MYITNRIDVNRNTLQNILQNIIAILIFKNLETLSRRKKTNPSTVEKKFKKLWLV